MCEFCIPCWFVVRAKGRSSREPHCLNVSLVGGERWKVHSVCVVVRSNNRAELLTYFHHAYLLIYQL